MLIDKNKFISLVNNILSLPGTNEIIDGNQKLIELIGQVSAEYDILSGLLYISDDITDDVMNTDLLSLIGNVKSILIEINTVESKKMNLNNKNMLTLIRYILNNNPCDNEYSEIITCNNCDGIMLYEGKFLRCNQCNVIQYNDIDNFNIDNSNAFDNNTNSRNSNIIKHLHKNLSHIYGESWPDKLPDGVRDIICEEIKLKLPNLHEAVHLSYEVHELLHNMRFIFYEGKVYKPKDYKIYTNSFIVKSFPDITIRKLDTEDHELLNNSFLEITAEFLNIITQKTVGKISKYNNNYLYTIHRILFMKLRHKEYIRQLLRFIYIQSPSSFSKKDKKLRKVDNKIKCFTNFYDTPPDIYINERYYS